MAVFILSTVKMEFVPLRDTVLNYLAREDPELKKVFCGVFPANKLPPVTKWRVFSDAYIVNTDSAGEPGGTLAGDLDMKSRV